LIENVLGFTSSIKVAGDVLGAPHNTAGVVDAPPYLVVELGEGSERNS
jgi:hypothetical protein